MEISGIGNIVAPLTPFSQDLKVDFKTLEVHLDYVIEECHPIAISVGGVETQEYQYLSFEERVDLIRKSAEFIGGRCPIVVGISHPAYSTSIDLAKIAEKVGSAAIQILAPLRPFGGTPTQKEILDYYNSIARETSLPIVAYHNPGPGADLSVDTMIKVAELECVKYFKESSRDMRRIGVLIEEIERKNLAHYYTTMEMLLPTLMMGGSGGTMPPPAAKIGHDLVKSFQNGDISGAISCQRKFYQFPGRWNDYGLAPLMKLAMKTIGKDVGLPYPPFGPIPENDQKEIARKVTEIFGVVRA